ncbi:MAG: RNA polymerase sigma factor [Verrucomicrobiota bacterium]
MDTIERDARDREDMLRLANGHDAALNDLMGRHAQPIFHFLFRMLGNEDEANDLAQETFVRVFRSRSKFKPEARFTTWLYTIAGNLARNHYRWRSRHPNVSLDTPTADDAATIGEILPDKTFSPDQSAAQSERVSAVRCAVEKLPADMREAIILCEWEELSVNEAAEVLSSTPRAVESRLYRARKLLRYALAEWL